MLIRYGQVYEVTIALKDRRIGFYIKRLNKWIKLEDYGLEETTEQGLKRLYLSLLFSNLFMWTCWIFIAVLLIWLTVVFHLFIIAKIVGGILIGLFLLIVAPAL